MLYLKSFMIGGRKQKSEQGFTLIEILVSVTVFVVVVSIAAVLFISISNTQRKALNQEKLVRDVRSVTETVTRLARMYPVDYLAYNAAGYDFPENDGGTSILFLRVAGETVSFSVKNKRIVYENNQGEQFLTSPEITIDRFYFYISPLNSGDSANPPRVTMHFGATRVGEGGAAADISIQTSVVSRWYGGGGALLSP
jgi:prepilin-type N-terminal cleavage/methylation domain-containing protein